MGVEALSVVHEEVDDEEDGEEGGDNEVGDGGTLEA